MISIPFSHLPLFVFNQVACSVGKISSVTLFCVIIVVKQTIYSLLKLFQSKHYNLLLSNAAWLLHVCLLTPSGPEALSMSVVQISDVLWGLCSVLQRTFMQYLLFVPLNHAFKTIIKIWICWSLKYDSHPVIFLCQELLPALELSTNSRIFIFCLGITI